MKKLVFLPILVGHTLIAAAACPTWSTTERFDLNGAEVRDRHTGLVWSRCSVGQRWDGNTCAGAATALTHEQALQYADSQSDWRLPNVRELSSLADLGCVNPAIDKNALPTIPSSLYWTSSPNVGNSTTSWVVESGSGGVTTIGRHLATHVRLVRVSR